MRFKGGIRRKVVLFIRLSTLLVMVVGLSLGYSFGFNLLKETIGGDYEKIADVLASNVQQRINEEISYIKGSMISLGFKNALKKSNARYQKMVPTDIQKFMADMDKQWIKADKDSSLVKGYLETNASLELKSKCKENKQMSEVFLSDRFGGLVAASGKTTDFYQADELWWQSAFAEGKGEIFAGGIEFDESSNTLGMTFALPIKDDDGSVIGIAKAIVNIRLLFSFLADFKLDHTGYAALVDEKGYVISYKGIKPLSRQFLSNKEFQKILQGKTRRIIINRSNIHPERSFSAFAEVKYPLFLKRGVVWRVFVEQNTKEAFWPLYRLILQLTGLLIFLIVLVPVLGIIFGNRFAGPIEKLKEASEHIARGELDYPIGVKTGDELEELANSFRVMSLSVKEREDQLVSQKVYSQSIVASMADALIVINPDATLKSVNTAVLDLLGYREDELIGQPLKKIFLQKGEEREEGCGELYKYFRNIIEKGAAYNIDLTFLTKQGKGIPINFSGALMQQDGKIIGIVGVARDMRQIMTVISDLEKKEKDIKEHDKNLTRMQRAMLHIMGDLDIAKKDTEKANKELQKLDQLKSDFVSIVSHELRTPLTVTREGISQVLDGVRGEINKKQKQFLSMSIEGIDRLSRLIENLLDISKIEAHKIELKKELIDIVSLVKKVSSSFFASAFQNKRLEIRYNFPKERIELYLDKDWIIQVFVNLISNTLKFTSVGYIEISIVDKENVVECAVSDTGIGISDEDLPKIFSKFEQFGREFESAEKGTGLGLAISKGIIELHRGKIWVESPAWPALPAGRQGTKISFTIPKCTPRELFREYVADGLAKAIKEGTSLSVIIFEIKNYATLREKLGQDKIISIMHGLGEFVKTTLRRHSDISIEDSQAILVVLSEVDKKGVWPTAVRLKSSVDNYLSREGLAKEIEVDLRTASFPEDANTGEELLNKAQL